MVQHTLWDAEQEATVICACLFSSLSASAKHHAADFLIALLDALPPSNAPSVVTGHRTSIKLFARSWKPLSCASHHQSLTGFNVLSGSVPYFFLLLCLSSDLLTIQAEVCLFVLLSGISKMRPVSYFC